ncbi:hypothetical protein [Legionella waltersii]|uniref:Uncharacterized protein n=1 Tax=Legionella waltersii TaxID=66969 RepID=A0A0W1A5C8_9GAMM|nr:hypothetical protein [Legionella waltersii]KTD76549.1 hypothetical protein Lwal_2271 [Legionella waltersii]SNU94056.1 Uncharacterised protein [Legionella waltersii]
MKSTYEMVVLYARLSSEHLITLADFWLPLIARQYLRLFTNGISDSIEKLLKITGTLGTIGATAYLLGLRRPHLKIQDGAVGTII